MALNIRAGGSWLPAKVVRTRVAGVWTPAKVVRQRINGVWTVIWTSLAATCANFIGTTGNVSRTVTVTGGTAPFNVTSRTVVANSGPTPSATSSGLSVTLFYPGSASEGSVTITVTDANGSTAVCTVGYAFAGPL